MRLGTALRQLALSGSPQQVQVALPGMRQLHFGLMATAPPDSELASSRVPPKD